MVHSHRQAVCVSPAADEGDEGDEGGDVWRGDEDTLWLFGELQHVWEIDDQRDSDMGCCVVKPGRDLGVLRLRELRGACLHPGR